jgi:hypothetical protein
VPGLHSAQPAPKTASKTSSKPALALHTQAATETLPSRRVIANGEPSASAHDAHATVPSSAFSTLNQLTAQGAHAALPVSFLEVPAAHARHSPSAVPKNPRRHTQSWMRAEPGSEVLFTVHARQAAASPSSSSACSLYVPVAHAAHSPVPTSSMPGPQRHA